MKNKKSRKSAMRRRLSTLLWLVLFVFGILLVSMVVSGIVWHFMTTIGVLSPFTAERAVQAFLFMLLVSLFIGTALATIGGDYLLRPLRRLTAATKEIANGNFNIHVDAGGSRELERLADSFNEMAKELSGIETLRADFVSNISHEYKTPIASIRGFAKRLKRDGLTDEQRNEYLDIIIYESERLSRLSGNVLLLSNLENIERYSGQTEYSLDEQLRRAVLLLEPQLQKKHLLTEIKLDAVRITANEEMLNHLWINLLGNAVKFSHDKGIIAVSLELQDSNAIVKISDEGIGMDDETKKHMYEKFYQGDSSRTTDGSGLGLSLVKRILELENGRISIDSEPGRGTCITISLPA